MRETNDQQQASAAQAHGTANNRAARPTVYLKVKIGNRPCTCLLDTGCDATLIPTKMVRGNNTILKTDQQCIAANGTQIPIVGTTTIRATVGDFPMEIKGLVTDHVSTTMLGIDWLLDNDVTWNFNSGEIQLGGRTFYLLSRKSRQNWSRRIILTSDTVLPPRSQLDVMTKAVVDEVSSDTSLVT